MKKVYIATYRSSEKRTVKVFGSDEEDAKKAAFAAYTYNGSMWYPNPAVDEIVEKVELDPDQVMNGPGVQPSVQTDYKAPTAVEVMNDQFAKKEG